MSKEASTTTEIMEIVKAMPGVTAKEITELMPHISKTGVTCGINSLFTKGLLVSHNKRAQVRRDGNMLKVREYTVSDTPVPVGRAVKRKVKAPTEVGYAAQIDALKATIAELEDWKKQAINRFPDLAVDPVILQARKLVSEELIASGDRTLAEQVSRGQKDCTLMMRVAIKALERV